jgi:DNA-binding transcriptional LysR family regulator
MLSLNQLRTFVAVAETGSVGGAADQLAISQPAVSAAIASLSEHFGSPLIEREGRGTRLTPAGAVLATHARRIFAMLDQTQRETANAARNKQRRLRLATVTTVAEHVIANLLRGFRSREPDVDVELYVGNRANVWGRLRHWEVDLVIGGRPPEDPAFRNLALRSNELIAVRAPEYTAEYSRATWLLREPGSGTRSTTESFFAQAGIDPPTLTIGSNGAIRECVRAGIGMSLLSRDAVSSDIETRSLAVVSTPATPLVRNWHLVASADAELPSSAQQFTEYAIETGAFETDLDK